MEERVRYVLLNTTRQYRLILKDDGERFVFTVRVSVDGNRPTSKMVTIVRRKYDQMDCGAKLKRAREVRIREYIKEFF